MKKRILQKFSTWWIAISLIETVTRTKLKPWSQRPIRPDPIRSDQTQLVELNRIGRVITFTIRSDPIRSDSTGASVFNRFWTFWRLSSRVVLSCKRDHSARFIPIRFNSTDSQSWPSFTFLLLGESPTYLLNLYWNKLTHLFFCDYAHSSNGIIKRCWFIELWR